MKLIIFALIVLAIVGVIFGIMLENEDVDLSEINPFRSNGTAEEIVTPDRFVLPDGFSAIELEVTNKINDFTFKLIGCYSFDVNMGLFNVRVYQSEISYYMHYLQISGYTFEGFENWEKSTDGSYYETTFKAINMAKLIALNAPATFDIIFMDGVTNTVIQSLTASYGSEVKAPSAIDYTSEGLVFVGWEGADYSCVKRNGTVYSVYAPARYITCKLPDGSVQRITVAAGSSLAEVVAPDYEGKSFKYWRGEDGNKIDASAVTVDYDMNLEAVYSSALPKWVTTLLIAIGGIAAASLFIAFLVKVLGNRVRNHA